MDHTFAVMAYKDSPYLIECLESLRNQSVQSRIYISTSTPSDFLTFIATKYGVELHTSNRGGGIAQDWNAAYQLATTKYVTLVHQDDIYLPDYLKECLRAAEKFPDTLICFTDYDEIIHGEERKSTLMLDVKRFMLNTFLLFRKNLQSKFWKNALLSFGCPIAAPSVMFNKQMIPALQFSPEFFINVDWDAWYRLAGIKGRFVYVPKVLLRHRIHADSMTSTGLQKKLRQEEDLRIFRRFWPGLFAKAIAKVYSVSYKSNEIKREP